MSSPSARHQHHQYQNALTSAAEYTVSQGIPFRSSSIRSGAPQDHQVVNGLWVGVIASGQVATEETYRQGLNTSIRVRHIPSDLPRPLPPRKRITSRVGACVSSCADIRSTR